MGANSLLNRWKAICLVVAFLVGNASCSGGPFTDVTEPDELVNPIWMVVEIDDEPVPFDEVYFWFSSELKSATLATHIVARGGGVAPRCRESVSEVNLDIDGDRLTITGFEDVRLVGRRASCDQALADLHDRIAHALEKTESWERTSETLILSGASRVTLESGDSSD